MILLIGLGLLFAALLATGALGLAFTARERGMGSVIALGGGAVFVVVVGALAVAMVGLGSGEGDTTSSDNAPTETTERTSPRSTVVRSTVPAVAPGETLDGPQVLVSAAMPYGASAPVVGRLPSRSVLDIAAIGFPPSVTGAVAQCGPGGCANDFPVTFDANGEARFQYLVREDFGRLFNLPSTCRSDEPPCVVKVSAPEKVAYLRTVFRDAAAKPRRVTLTPGVGGLVDGAPVLVTATGFEPGDEVQAMLCAAPDTFGATRCGAPGPVAQFTIRPDGTGTTTLLLREGRVGSGGARCSRASQRCGVAVVDPRSAAPGAIAAFAFSTGTGARYDRDRLAIGLVVALLLLALAALLVRTTDWRKPSEADTPELDRATLLD